MTPHFLQAFSNEILLGLLKYNHGWKWLLKTRQMIQISRKVHRNDQNTLEGNYYKEGTLICSYMDHCWE
jgi:hypothetical protein